MSDKKTEKRKILIWAIIVAVFMMLCGTIVIAVNITKEDVAREEPDDREMADSGDEDSDLEYAGGIIEYVDTSKKNNDCMTIASMLDVLQVTAADPIINWGTEEVTVIFTEGGGKYICGNAEVIKGMSDIMPEKSASVSQWSDGWEIRAQKEQGTGKVKFSFRGDYDALKEFKPDLAARFSVILEN